MNFKEMVYEDIEQIEQVHNRQQQKELLIRHVYNIDITENG
jgi:hypothetical protein